LDGIGYNGYENRKILHVLKVQSGKAKGRRLQQYVVSELLDDITSRSMGAGGEDILLSPIARQTIPFSIECKNTERLDLWKALQQAEENANEHIPLVIFKRNRSKVYAVIEFDKLKELLWPTNH
jgi:hypothetical protein